MPEPTTPTAPTTTPSQPAAASPAPAPSSTLPGGVSAAGTPGQPAGAGGTTVRQAMAAGLASSGLDANQPAAGLGGAADPNGQTTPAAQPAAAPSPEQFQQLQQQLEAMQAQQTQLAQWAQYGYQQYQQAQQRPAQQPAQQPGEPAKPKSVFGIPDIDEVTLSFLQRNPQTGEIEAKPFAPPDTMFKYQQYLHATQKVQQDFWRDPMKFFKEPIQEMIREEAQRIAGQQVQQYSSSQMATDYVGQNAGWLYQHDQAGRPQVNPVTGQRVLSPHGQQFAQYVQLFADRGFSVADQQRLAEQMVFGGLAIQRVQQQSQAHQQAQAGNQAVLASAPPMPGSPPTVPAPAVPGNGAPAGLRNRLRTALAQSGIAGSAEANV